MDLNEFQLAALLTDNTGESYKESEGRKDVIVALLGIAGELGTLATAYKKFLRDGPAYELYKDNVREELGDLLWYVAVVAHKFDLELSEIARANLTKTTARWGTVPSRIPILADEGRGELEEIPRKFTIKFSATNQGKIIMEWDGKPLGNPLTDNAKYEDGYRFHDAFHLAYAAVLGWSPVIRKLMGKKRKSDPLLDENEDGGRAIVIEEGIAAYVFEYGEAHGALEGVTTVDFEVLKTVKNMTQRLEVSAMAWNDWEKAILDGYAVFRSLRKFGGGFVDCDLLGRQIAFRRLGR
jgi:NTP pyrophosphatase (non-canonical NTP hydrolase)